MVPSALQDASSSHWSGQTDIVTEILRARIYKSSSGTQRRQNVRRF